MTSLQTLTVYPSASRLLSPCASQHIWEDVRLWTRTCTDCQASMGTRPILDHVGPLPPSSGYHYILSASAATGLPATTPLIFEIPTWCLYFTRQEGNLSLLDKQLDGVLFHPLSCGKTVIYQTQGKNEHILTVRMEPLLLYSKTVLPNSRPAQSNSFVFVSLLLHILLVRSLLTLKPVTKQGDSSNPTYYRSLGLIFCLSKAFESVPNKRIMRHLSAHNLLSDCQYGFRKGRSTGDLLAFLTESFRDFGETFLVGFNISKAFDRVRHKSLNYKLSSYGFYLSLCTFISSFLSDQSIAAIVDGHCFSLKTIKSGVLQGSIISPTLFLLFINDLLNLTQCPIHSYADDTTLHFSTTYIRCQTQ